MNYSARTSNIFGQRTVLCNGGHLPCLRKAPSIALRSAPCIHQPTPRSPSSCAARRKKGPQPGPEPSPGGGGVSSASGDDEDDPPNKPYVRKHIKIDSQNHALEHLVRDIENGKLNLQPDYQRDFVWKPERCMSLIKTVFEGLPMPAIMLYERCPDGPNDRLRRDVLDGKQRLGTLYSFIRGRAEFPGAPIVLKFDEKEDEVEAHLHGKAFKDLSVEEQSYIENYMVQVQIIDQNSDLDIVYHIYRAINTGGEPHSDQQLRRAVFHGPYVQLLDELAKPPAGGMESKFVELADLSREEQSRQQTQELILRFFALRRAAASHPDRRFKQPMRKFLDSELQNDDHVRKTALEKPLAWPDQLRVPSETEKKKMAEVFNNTVTLLDTLKLKEVAEEALKGAKGKSFRKAGSGVNWTVWDVTLVGLSLALDSTPKLGVYRRNARALQDAYRALLGSERWARLTSATLSHENFMERLAAFDEEVVKKALRGDPKA